MTQPKTLSPAEALRALADEKKLRSHEWKSGQYIYLNGETITYGCGQIVSVVQFDGLHEYTEPKPKRKLAPYYVEHDHGRIALEDKCFETDEQARKYFETESVTRCMVLEREF